MGTGGVRRWFGPGLEVLCCGMSCESELFVYMAGPGICILCYADTGAS